MTRLAQDSYLPVSKSYQLDEPEPTRPTAGFFVSEPEITPEKKGSQEDPFDFADRYALPVTIWIGLSLDKIADKGIVTVSLDVTEINPVGNVFAYQHIIPRQGELPRRML